MRINPIILFSILATGCTGIVSESFDAAPEWFQEKREELSGQGYPSFKQAESLMENEEEAPWGEISRDLALALRQMQAADPGPVTMTAEDMRAWANAQKALVAKGEEPY